MKNNLLIDFKVNKENRTIQVTREFDANLELVWKAWTTQELLEKWWAPKPWKAQTKSMEFKEGGYWLYAMVSPEGEKHWSKVKFISISKEKSFTAEDSFSNENGVINSDFPKNVWENQFHPKDEKTLVNITLSFDTQKDLEKLVAMGFKEGFTMGLNQLDELLFDLKKQS